MTTTEAPRSLVPVFTVTERFCLFGGDDDVKTLAPRRSPCIINPNDIHVSIYVHGYAERMAKFDIPQLIDGDLEIKEHAGTHCLLDLGEHQLACKLYTWPTGRHVTGEPSGKRKAWYEGLIVSMLDGKSIEFCEKARTKKESCL